MLKMKNKMVNIKILMVLLISIMVIPFVFAGVGLKWDQETALVEQGGESCMTYSVYNPWPKDTYVTIELSDELKQILILQDVETKLIPANTGSKDAIPIKFCFKVPQVYEKDCLIGNSLGCTQRCEEEQKVYSGEVVVKSVASPNAIGGSGGSSTTMAVSAPLKIKVKCDVKLSSLTPFTLTLWIISVISLLIIIFLVIKKYRKPALERDKEKLRKLQEKLKKEKSKQKK